MSNRYLARLRFLSKEEGGRITPPTGKLYSTVARFRFADQPDEWSVVLTFVERIGVSAVAQVTLLSPIAPQAYLHRGARFQLLEGKNVVADGEIFGESGAS